jgi:hypothetical protein
MQRNLLHFGGWRLPLASLKAQSGRTSNGGQRLAPYGSTKNGILGSFTLQRHWIYLMQTSQFERLVKNMAHNINGVMFNNAELVEYLSALLVKWGVYENLRNTEDDIQAVKFIVNRWPEYREGMDWDATRIEQLRLWLESSPIPMKRASRTETLTVKFEVSGGGVTIGLQDSQEWVILDPDHRAYLLSQMQKDIAGLALSFMPKNPSPRQQSAPQSAPQSAAASNDSTGEKIEITGLLVDFSKGKRVVKIRGGKFQKFGVPCWSEMWEKTGAPSEKDLDLGEYAASGWMVVSDSDKGGKVIALEISLGAKV